MQQVSNGHNVSYPSFQMLFIYKWEIPYFDILLIFKMQQEEEKKQKPKPKVDKTPIVRKNSKFDLQKSDGGEKALYRVS